MEMTKFEEKLKNAAQIQTMLQTHFKKKIGNSDRNLAKLSY